MYDEYDYLIKEWIKVTHIENLGGTTCAPHTLKLLYEQQPRGESDSLFEAWRQLLYLKILLLH
jgi:hypothetical protein